MIESEQIQIMKNLPEFSRTRFAPSPTGFLHLGHVLSAAYVWLIARLKGAQVLLRVEDHDSTRCREDYVRSIYDDLKALGFHADLGGDYHDATFRQSKHQSRYIQTLAQLDTYSCCCTRRQISNRKQTNFRNQSTQCLKENRFQGGFSKEISLYHPQELSRNAFQGASFEDELSFEPTYDKFCRDKKLSDGVLRLRCPESEASFFDGFLQERFLFSAGKTDDFLIRERNGNFSYQYCVVVDDFYEGIDMVIRGQDLLSTTGNQLRLHDVLGNPKPPLYFHHPLVTDQDGKKLSKRFYSESVQSMLQKGQSSREILGKACALGGLWHDNSSVDLEELIEFYKVVLNR